MLKQIQLIGLIVTVNCAAYKPELRPYNSNSNTSNIEAKNLFSGKSQTKVKWKALKTGTVLVPMNLLLNMDNSATSNLAQKDIAVPVYAHLVKHPKHGDILIDTGFDSSFSKSGHGNFGCLAKFFNFALQNPGEDIASQIKKENAAVNTVILTHAHGDHTAGFPDLEKNIKIITGKETIHDAYDDTFGVCLKHLDNFKEIEEVEFKDAKTIGQNLKYIDLFGDNSILLLHTPGHSEGHISILLSTESGIVLLTGDASHTAWGFKNNVEPGKMINREKGKNSLKELKILATEILNVKLFYGHDNGTEIIMNKK